MPIPRFTFVFAVFVAACLSGIPTQRCPAAENPPPGSGAAAAPATPKVGDKAQDHSLQDVNGKMVRLSDELKRGPVVVVVLRGWPGYQCPFCSAQFADFLGHEKEFQAAQTRVLFVYPGPADGLREHAAEFQKDRPLPENFRLLVDPDYKFAIAHGLRWDAPRETVYPATFVLDRGGVIRFAQVSHEHGGRVPAKEILTVLASLPASDKTAPASNDH